MEMSLSPLKWYNPKDVIYLPQQVPLSQYSVSSRAGKGQLGPVPLSLGSFLLSYLFQVPFCYLGWKFHTCSAQRNAAHAGQRACQEIGSNFSFVASSHICEAVCATAWAVPPAFSSWGANVFRLLALGSLADLYRQPGSWPLKVQRPFVWYSIWCLPGISMIFFVV